MIAFKPGHQVVLHDNVVGSAVVEGKICPGKIYRVVETNKYGIRLEGVDGWWSMWTFMLVEKIPEESFVA